METQLPVAAFVEEAIFDLEAAATRNGPTIDTKDWYGSTQPDFTEARQFGFPLLEGAIFPPANCNVVVQYAVPTFPIAEPPVLTFSTFLVIAAPGGAWTEIALRVRARFARLQVVDTSGAPQADIYLVAFLRGA